MSRTDVPAARSSTSSRNRRARSSDTCATHRAVRAATISRSGTTLEIVFRFHLTDPVDLNLGARRPRDNPDWPEVGIFGHRNMRRLNWLGVSRCRLLKVDGLDLHVEDLDAVDGTPVLDIKPWFTEMGPRGSVRQAGWSHTMLREYYAQRSTT